MTDGYFVVRTGIYNDASPISGARIYIRKSRDEALSGQYNPETDVSEKSYDYYTVTDENGKSSPIRLDAPSVEYSFGEGSADKAYSRFDVLVEASDFVPVFVRGVQIFPNLQSELPINLEPYVSTFPRNFVQSYSIPQNAAVSTPERTPEYSGSTITPDVLSEVVIPSTIVVHLGTPSDTTAQNVTVPFTDYVKNVASSEIFPTWNEEAIRANIYAQISLALNRIYTEWYAARGYPFQITNSTQFDQAFVNGRNIYDNISRIVDEIFNTYLRKDGNYEPFFAQYCDGIRTTCNGMSQWGSQSLAERGYTATEILKNYYGDTIELATTDNIRDAPVSYPGTPLRLGSVGRDVLEMQIQLDRIREDYPLIPEITRLNGRFGSETESAVRVFQDIFDLSTDGIVGKATWYKISRIYSAVTRLGEITSEGTETFIPENPPDEVLYKGSSGDNVRLVQFILEYLSFFYPTIPVPTVDGYFGSGTEGSVIGFQKTFGLEADGKVGETTWDALYAVSGEINRAIKGTGDEQKYPGTPLRVGDSGRGVELMKIYYNKIAAYYGELPTVTVNDIFDSEFESAIKDFQQRYNLDPDGIIGALTWTRIVEIANFIDNTERRQSERAELPAFADSVPSVEYPGVTLKRGSNGRHVKYIQNALNVISKRNGKGAYLPVNGEFDSETELAVMSYQKSKGLARSGAVDKALWNRLICEADSDNGLCL
ncbi:MAG: peptidoglycan-binding protein [Clostridia bacterium]|nr:peptidoglycan-binding protein [Clostridia bacterium]